MATTCPAVIWNIPPFSCCQTPNLLKYFLLVLFSNVNIIHNEKNALWFGGQGVFQKKVEFHFDI